MIGNPNWSYQRSTPPQQNASMGLNISWNSSIHNSSSFNNSTTNASFNSPYRKYSKEDLITDEHSLENYLRFLFTS